MDYTAIPWELRALPQWVCHRYPNKMPLSPFPDGNGKLSPADCRSPATWGTFEDACRAIEQHGAKGLGIQLGRGICGVDIDHCVEDGELNALAREFLSALGSYAELSPSGTGVHILCKGSLPSREGRKVPALGLEMYDTGRYFTVTGKPICDEDGRPYPLRDCTEALARLHETYFPRRAPEQMRLAPEPSAAFRGNDARTVGNVRDLSDEELLRIAFRAKNGDEIERLYRGDWAPPQYPSQSEADFALVNRLAFWCNGDKERIDRLFRASGLYRRKWDRSVGGGRTYGEYTIDRAVRQLQSGFVPLERERPSRPAQPPLPEEPPDVVFRAPPSPPPSAGTPREPAADADPSLYTYDDTGNAHRFRDAYVRDVRFNHIDKTWMIWDGCRWTEDQTGQVKRLADELLQQLVRDAETLPNREELLKHVRRTRSSKAKEAMLHEAQHLPGIPILPNELDRYKDALNVRNGILDLKTGQLRPHDRKLCFSMLADAEYLPDAACPRWLAFLDDVTGGDKALQRYIQRMVGYFLTGSTREQCIFFLYGSGSNGKSTFVNTISSLFGDYTKNAQAETIMRNDRGGGSGARSDLARLKGVRLTTTSEPSGGCVLDEALVKTMTGDDVITARRLYREEFEFRPEFKILMATNYKPIIKHSDYGIWRRIRLLPFTVQIPPEKKDPQLGDKLREEKAGIFRWAVQGAIDWYREGLPPCPCIDRANEEYRLEMDKMQQFVGDCLVREPGSTLPSARLYDVYRAWCTEHGERFPLSQVRFSGELQDNYHFQRRKNRTCNEFVDAALTETGQELALAAPETFR